MNFTSIFNNGVALGCLTYFMFVTNTTLKDVTKALQENTQVVTEIKEYIRRN